MKYIVFYEWDEEDTEILIEKWRKIDELRKEDPDKYPKGFNLSQSPNGECNMFGCESPPWGFGIYEGTQEQFENWKEFYGPELRITGNPKLNPEREQKILFYASDYILEYLVIRMREKRTPEHEEICSRLIKRARVGRML